MTYKEKVVEVLRELGGHAYLNDIYTLFEKKSANMVLPQNYKAIIRATLERNSSDSSVFDGKENLFYSVDGIGNGHWGLNVISDTNVSSDILEYSQEDDEFSEGKLFLKSHLQRERNPRLISAAKKNFIAKNGHLFCEVCGFDFKKMYGDLGENFIEAHHCKPVSTMNGDEKTKIEDISMVCSNCHSMIHRRKPWLTKDELKAIVQTGPR